MSRLVKQNLHIYVGTKLAWQIRRTISRRLAVSVQLLERYVCSKLVINQMQDALEPSIRLNTRPSSQNLPGLPNLGSVRWEPQVTGQASQDEMYFYTSR